MSDAVSANSPGQPGPAGPCNSFNALAGPAANSRAGASGASHGTGLHAGPGGPGAANRGGASKTTAFPKVAPAVPVAPPKFDMGELRAALNDVFGEPPEPEKSALSKTRAEKGEAAPEPDSGRLVPQGDESNPGAETNSPLQDGDARAALFDAEEHRERTGVAIPPDAADAFSQAYARHLAAIAKVTGDKHGRRHLETAAAFCRHGWASKALALGWTTRELFALHPTHPWVRLECLGAAYLACEPVALTAGGIRLSSGLTCRRRPCGEGVLA